MLPQPNKQNNPLTLLFGSECGTVPTPEAWRTLIEDEVPDYVFAHVARIGRRRLRVDAWLVTSLALAGVRYLRIELRGGRRTQARYVWLQDLFRHGQHVEHDSWQWIDFDASLLHKYARPIRREVKQ